MATVTVPALKPLTHQGRSYVRGDAVTVEAIEAAAMAQRGEVSLTRGTKIKTRAMVAEAQPEPVRRTRRQYRTRVMTPETSGE